MNKVLSIILVIATIGLGAAALSVVADEASVFNNGPQGEVYFSVTDAAANMENVSEVMLTVDNVEMYSESEGWVEVSKDKKTYNLLELRDNEELKLLAKSEINADSYSKIRLDIGGVKVKTSDGETIGATLPSRQMEMDMTVNVKKDSKSHVTLDVLADQSLHTTVDGDYIFAPVIKVETRENPQINVSSQNIVSILGGNVESTSTIGTDIKGKTKAGFKIGKDIELKVGILGNINANGNSEAEIEESSTSSASTTSQMKEGGEKEGDEKEVKTETHTETESEVKMDRRIESGAYFKGSGFLEVN